ncbi:MAG: L-aspartate oxidase [Phycisphaeraceae bacterium]|nr:L-aspartate oxidase [Phycisphaeraceae bacterium]
MDPIFDQRRYLIPFRSSLLPQIFTDVLVIGAGVAGLRAAIAAAESPESGLNGATAGADVIVLSKEEPSLSNTAWAQGGISTVLDSQDSFDAHVRDTLDAGAGLCDEAVVRRVVEGAPSGFRDLTRWGMRFDVDETGSPRLGREGGHSAHRVLHAGGDATGLELERCLLQRARSLSTIRLFTKCFSLDLLTPSPEVGSPVLGAITHHPRYGLQVIWAKATIVASGGSGQLYRETTNPRVATADGIAMAYRAGASVADMAFVQFHPTTLYLAGAPRSLITEAIRGEGAHLVDESGHRFMLESHPLAELAPRDVVSRAIVRRLSKHGGSHVFLDVRHIREFSARFPSISAMLRRFDLDPATDLIPVNPAAHYMVGGVLTDLDGRTDVPGLYSVGETACSGLHGANRLASNSLLEGLVLGEAAGRAAAGVARSGRTPSAPVPLVSDIRPSDHGELDLGDVVSSLRSAMWRNVGVERSGSRLSDVGDMINFWARYTLDKIFDDPTGWQAQNMLLVGTLIAKSAAWREESRGCHTRTDFPEPREGFRVHDAWQRGASNPELRPAGSAPAVLEGSSREDR